MNNTENNSNTNKRFQEILSVIRKYKLIKEFTPEKLRHACEDLGPCFVKLGQMASVRPDLLPEEICSELSLLCHNIPPISMDEVRQSIEDAYGKPLEEVFASFDEIPRGSASLAQVHQATLPTGEAVAVKVQRPHAYENICRDLDLIEKFFSRFAKSKLVETFDLIAIIKEFRKASMEELDFIHEAQNIEEYNNNSQNLSYCEAPLVYMDYCRPTVLVMEYVEGPHIGDIEGLKKENYDLTDVALKYIKGYMKQVVSDGLFHSDPHTANLKLRNGKLVWIDWGMAGHFSKNDMALLKKFMMGLAEQDSASLTECLLVMNKGSKPVDKVILYNGIKSVFERLCILDLSDYDFGILMKAATGILRDSGVILSSSYIMLFRGLGTILGTVLLLDPEINAGQAIIDGITESAKLNRDNSEELQKWLKRRYKNFKKIASIPVNLADMIRDMSGNLSGMKIDINIPDNTQNFMIWMTKLIIEGLIIVALIISAAIIATAQMEPRILGAPIPSFVCFCAAVIVCIIMLFTFRRRK